MHFKLFSFVFAVLAVHMAAGAQIPHQTQDTTDDVIKALAGLLVNATSAATTALGKLDTSLANIEDNIESDESTAFNKIIQVVIDLNNAVLDDFASLSNSSDDTGKKLIACVQGVQDEANTLINSTLTELLTCSTTDSKTVVTHVRALVQDLSASLTKVGDSATELENCNMGSTVCGLAFVNSMSTIVKDFVNTAKPDYEAIVTIVKGLGDKITTCASSSSEDMSNNRIKLFNEITQCLSA